MSPRLPRVFRRPSICATVGLAVASALIAAVPSAGSAAPPAEQGDVDACSLVTEDQAAEFLGGAVRPPEALDAPDSGIADDPSDQWDTCYWAAEDSLSTEYGTSDFHLQISTAWGAQAEALWKAVQEDDEYAEFDPVDPVEGDVWAQAEGEVGFSGAILHVPDFLVFCDVENFAAPTGTFRDRCVELLRDILSARDTSISGSAEETGPASSASTETATEKVAPPDD